MRWNSGRRAWPIAILGVIAAAGASSAAFRDIEQEVVEFTLDNGLRFLVLERHTAPVFSYCTMIDAGGVDEGPGVTGVAHMFEHMAFKGTKTVGTTNSKAERKLFEKIDVAFAAWVDEWRNGPLADSARLDMLKADVDSLNTLAQEFVKTNEFTEILEEHGVVDLNAQTALDWTRYFYSLPSNRFELWALLEGDRLTNPILREFDTEREVVIEERRMRFESSPFGRLIGGFIPLAFPAHPYGDGIIGHKTDLQTFTRQDAQDFFDTYYVASNITIAVVGDVTVDQVREMAKKHFSKVHAGPKPPRVDTLEPEQNAERRLIIEDPAQPMLLVGYPVPEARDPDWTTFQLLAAVLGQGRSSRLYTALVKDDQLAAQVQSFVGFPGEKYPSLLNVLTVVAAGEDPREAEQAVYDVIEKDLIENPITQDELDGARTFIKAQVIRQMRSNVGLAQQLVYSEVVYGDWRRVFHAEEELDAVTVEDLSRVAASTFKRSRRNVAMIVNPQDG